MSDNDINVSFTANAEGLKTGAVQAAAAVQASVEKMTAAFDKMASQAKADAAAIREQMQEVAKSTESSASSVASVLGNLRGLFAGLSVGLLAKQFIELADSFSLVQARLRLATQSQQEFAEASKAIYEIAQRNSLGLQEATTLYAKLADPIRRVGGGAKETAAIVDAFATSLRVSGASTMEASSATMQFAQAMASGKLSGDEFRSMSEASPRFMRALADGMGQPIEKLKQMGSESKLTADVVGNALIKSLGALQKEAQGLPDTVGGAFTRLKNEVLIAVDAVNQFLNSTSSLASVVSVVADLVREFGRTMKEVAKETEGAASSGDDYEAILSVIGTIFETLVVLGANVAYVIKQTAAEFRGMYQQLVALKNLDFKEFKRIGDTMEQESARARAAIDKLTDKFLGMTDRIMKARREKLQMPDAEATPGAAPQANLKSNIKPDSGDKKDGRLELMRAQFQQEIQLQKGFFDTSVNLEIAYWEKKLATVRGKSADDIKLRTQIRMELYNLRKTEATQDRALDEQSLDQQAKLALEGLALERDALRQSKSTREVSLQEAMQLEVEYANQATLIRVQQLQDKAKLYEKDKVAYAKIQDEIVLLTRQNARDVLNIKRQYANEELAEEIANMRRQMEAAGNNLDARIEIAKQILAEVRKTYAAESREAQEAAAEVGRLERQKLEQKKQLAMQEIELRRSIKQSIVGMEQENAQLERDLGMRTGVELLNMQRQFETERYSIDYNALMERKKLLEQDPNRDPVEYKRVNDEILMLAMQHAARINQIQADMVREQNKYLLGAFSSIESGLANAFSGLMKGTTSFKQFMLDIAKSISNAFIDMFAKILAQRIMTSIAERVFAKKSAASDIQTQAARAGAGGVASMASAPFPMSLNAPAFGQAMFGAAMAFQAGLAVPSAAGGFDIPAGSNPLTQLHEREMVLPAKYADAIRDMADGGGAAAATNVRLEVHPDAMRMTLNDWLQGELARQAARR
jgi:tape measure domain-containing protein